MIAHLTPRTAAHVRLLIDPRVAVLRLVTALASAGLTIRHDHQRNALVVSTIR